jgi:hypothetical protein
MPTRLDYDWKKNLTQTQAQTQTQSQSQTLHFEKKTSVRCLLLSNADTVKTVSPVFHSRIIIKQQRNWEKE